MRFLRTFTGIWAGILLFSGGSVAVGAVQLKLPVPEVETLPNGLQLVWFVNDSLPVIDITLVVRSGYRDDPAGKSGTAEWVAALLDRGNAGLTARQIARSVESLGASRFIYAADDHFTVGIHGLAPDASELSDLLSKIALKAEFPESEATREHARLLDSWSHIGDNGATLAALAYDRVMTSGTDYGRGNFLSVREFKKVKREDALRYYKTHFTPKNSVLMVVGRVDRLEFKKRLQATWGEWQGEAPPRIRKAHSDPRFKVKKDQIFLLDRPNLTQAQVRMGFRAPLVNHPDHYALSVANALLGEYFYSRLNAVIRDQLALTYSISSSFSYSKEFAKFTIASSTRNESTGQLIRQAVNILKGLKAGPIPEEEIRMAQDYLAGGFPLSVSTLGSVASHWLSGYLFDRGPDYLNHVIPRIRAVTREQVLSVAGRHFDLDHLVIVVAGNSKEILKSLKASRLNSVKKLTIQDLGG